MPWTVAPGRRPPTTYIDRAGTRTIRWILIDYDTANHRSVDVTHHHLTLDHRAVDLTHNDAVISIPTVSVSPACFSGSRIGGSADHQESECEDALALG